ALCPLVSPERRPGVARLPGRHWSALTSHLDMSDPAPTAAPGALADLTVLDLTEGVAGPFGTKLLADLGARVIKVEPPGGDRARRLAPFAGDRPARESSLLFAFLNTNKRSVVLDLERAAGRAAVRALAAQSDL